MRQTPSMQSYDSQTVVIDNEKLDALPPEASVTTRVRLLWVAATVLVLGYPVALYTAKALTQYVDAAFFLAVILSSAGACWLAYRKGTTSERRFWLLLVAINMLTLVSQLWAALYIFDSAGLGQPLPSWVDLVNLAAAGCFVGLVVSVVRGRMWTRTSAARHVVDGISLVAVAYSVLALGYVGPLFMDAGIDSIASIAAGTGYPVLGVSILFLSFMGILGPRAHMWFPWERLVAASLAVYSAGLIFWPVFWVQADYILLNPWAIGYSLVFLMGHYLMFAAAVVRLGFPEEWVLRPGRSSRRIDHGKLAILAPALVLVVTVVLAYVGLRGAGPEYESQIATGCAMVLGTLFALRSAALVHENAHLHAMVVTDQLTGLLDRRQLLATSSDMIASAERYGDPVALVVLDLDDFSAMNARIGSKAADAVLRQVGTATARLARPGDLTFRSGDDQFAILMPDCTAIEALSVADELRTALAAVPTGCDMRLTASFGVAVFPEDALDHEELVKRAEGASYHGKSHGKDQVTRYDVSRALDLSPKQRAARLEVESRLSTVRALAAAVDARDAATQFHSRNVARLAVLLAQELGLPDDRTEALETAALLHDIGKIGISDRVLRKAGRLTPIERAEVQQHAILGERILAGTSLTEVLPWILHHHERWDGAGYPARLAGDQIPFEARVLAVCDAYDAMTSDRPYRSALSAAAALQEIDLNMGTQFDPVIAEAFIRVLGRSSSPQDLLETNR